MQILIITTNGITREFESWPERLQGRALVQRGHNVRAYTYLGNKSWNSQKEEEIDGIKVRRFKRRQWLSFGLTKAMLFGPKPDLVHMHHLSGQFNYLAALIYKLKRVPVVFTPHGPFHDPYLVEDRDRPFEKPARYRDIITTLPKLAGSLRRKFKPKRALKNYLTHAPLRLASRVIALSRHECEVLKKLGVAGDRIVVIPNAIDPGWLSGIEATPKSHDEFRVLFMGQLKYRKGFDLLAQAILPVVRKFPQTRFVFAGHSPIHEKELLEIVDRDGVRGYVNFPGHLSDKEKAALFQGSDLYVLPTRYEGFGIPLLEAMSAGCPVISTNIPVIDEIIQDGDNGLLFEYDSPADLSRKIIQALENPMLRKRLADQGRLAVEPYYTPAVIARLEKVYFELCPAGAENPTRW